MKNQILPVRFRDLSMRFILLTLSCIAFIEVAKAQDYAVIKPNQVQYFMKSIDHSLFAIKVDSVMSDSTGQTFEFFKQWNFYSNSGIVCPVIPNWIGYRCRLSGDGQYLFEMDYPGQILIKSRASVGESWDYFVDLEENRVVASVIEIVEDFVHGGLDSIKIIQLQLVDSNGVHLISPINDLQIHLSKSNGLTKMVNVRDFPQVTNSYELDGYYEDNQSHHGLTWKDIFDYSAGDEFHYWAIADIELGDPRYTIYRVLSRVESSGGQVVAYQMERKRYPITFVSGSPEIVSSDIQVDTIIQEYNFAEDSLMIPGQAILTIRPHVLNLQYAMKYSNLYFNRRVVEGKGDINLLGGMEVFDGCVFEFESSDLQYTYGEGLGLTQYYLQYFEGAVYYGYLVYYRKGSEEYGTALTIEEVVSAFIDPSLIYPNPGTGVFYIKADKIQTISVFNVFGQFIKEIKVDQPGEVCFDLRGQAPGIYHVHLRCSNTHQIRQLILL